MSASPSGRFTRQAKCPCFPASGINRGGGEDKITRLGMSFQTRSKEKFSHNMPHNCQNLHSKIPARRSKSVSRTIAGHSQNLITTAHSGKTKACYIHHIAPSCVTQRPFLTAAARQSKNAPTPSYTRPNSRRNYAKFLRFCTESMDGWPQFLHACVLGQHLTPLSAVSSIQQPPSLYLLLGPTQLPFSGYHGLFPVM
jgi:hypothetical protein